MRSSVVSGLCNSVNTSMLSVTAGSVINRKVRLRWIVADRENLAAIDTAEIRGLDDRYDRNAAAARGKNDRDL